MIAVRTLSFGPPLPQERGKVCPPCFPQPRPLSTCKQDTQTWTTQDHYVGTNPPPAHAHPCSNRGTYQRVCPPPPFLYPRPHLCAYRTRKTWDDMVTSPLSYPPCSRAIRGCMTKSTMLDTRHVGTGAFRVFTRNTFHEHPTCLPSHISTHGGRCATSGDIAVMSTLPTLKAFLPFKSLWHSSWVPFLTFGIEHALAITITQFKLIYLLCTLVIVLIVLPTI